MCCLVLDGGVFGSCGRVLAVQGDGAAKCMPFCTADATCSTCSTWQAELPSSAIHQ